MANDIRGEVAFTALGRDWILRLGNGAVRSVETATGKPFGRIGKELNNEETASVTLLTEVFCAGLRRNQPDVTIEDCDDIIDELGHEKSGELLREAFIRMQPKGGKGGDARPRKATTKSTGRR